MLIVLMVPIVSVAGSSFGGALSGEPSVMVGQI